MSRVTVKKMLPGYHRAEGTRALNIDVEARVAADQANRRADKMHWLELEQQKYGLPKRGRLIDDMAA